MNDPTHPMKVETQTQSGELVAGAECKLTNDKGGTIAIKSGETAQVRRSDLDLLVDCKAPNHPDAHAQVISRVNAAMFGNILLGGGVGAFVDTANGKAYTYPGWVRLIFGQTLVFDRRLEKEGQPTPATQPGIDTAPVQPGQEQSFACRWKTKDCPT